MPTQAPRPLVIQETPPPAPIGEFAAGPSGANPAASQSEPEIPHHIESLRAAVRHGSRDNLCAPPPREPDPGSGDQTPSLPPPGQSAAIAQAPGQPTCKPYLSIAELTHLTPWTDQAIRTMISRGILREGSHFFYVGRRPVFKWAAIVTFIERPQPREPVPHYRDQVIDGAKT